MNQPIITDLTSSEKSTKKPFFLKAIQQKISTSRSSYLGLCFAIPVVLTFLIYLAMEHHPFGDGSVLVLDLNAQYVYFFEALRRFVYGDADILYSFSRALGGEFVGMYAYYLASPLSFIVALFPQERILEALLTMILLKSGLCGFTFGFYLHKNSKNTNRVMIIAFSTMYALSAYAVVHQNNTMWIDALIWLPLLTYGIEQLVKFGKYKLFVIALAMTVWSNYYIGYMVCIYVALYFFYYFMAYGDGRNNPRGERAHFIRSLIRIVFFSALAVAIAAFIILGAYYSLGFGKSDFSNPNWALRAKFGFLDFFTKLLPGSYDTVRPEGLPFVYTGILTLILVPVFFISKKFTSREKVASLAFIAFFVLSFMASTLDLIWHGFQNPNWLNNRYSFMLCFFLLVLAYKAFGNLREISNKFLLAICAFIILLIALAEKQEFSTYVESESKLLTLETVWLSVLAVVIITTLLCLIISTKNVRKRENLAGILAAIVCVELFCSSLACVVQFDKDVLYSGYSGYNDFLENVRSITDVVQENDTSFYRMEQNNKQRVNDNMATGVRGLSNSTSTLNSDTISFLHKMGYASITHWSQYIGGTPVNDSLLGIKYIIDTENSKTSELYYTQAYSSDKYVAYLNPNALSLAYGTSGAVKDFDMNAHDGHFERLNALISTMLGDQETLRVFVPLEVDESKASNCETTRIAGHIKYTADTSSKATVTFQTTVTQDGEVFFYAPSDYTRETKLSVNGRDKGKYFSNDTDRIISLGIFEAGDSITLKLTLEGEDLYLKMNCEYFYYLDTEVYNEAFARLKSSPQYQIDEGFTDSHLTGTISTSDADQTVFTTIPYDKGWKIFVDGVEVETYEVLDALIAFDISEAGDHTLEMKYAPAVYRLGAIISISGIIIFITICIIELVSKKLFRRIFKLEVCKAEDNLWVLDDFDSDTEEIKLLPPTEKKTFKELFSVFARSQKNVAPEVTQEQNSSEINTDDTSETPNENNENKEDGGI